MLRALKPFQNISQIKCKFSTPQNLETNIPSKKTAPEIPQTLSQHTEINLQDILKHTQSSKLAKSLANLIHSHSKK